MYLDHDDDSFNEIEIKLNQSMIWHILPPCKQLLQLTNWLHGRSSIELQRDVYKIFPVSRENKFIFKFKI